MADITLYHSPASRAFIAYWLLEELGTPFKVRTVDIRKGEQKRPDYLRINPMGKVPALTDGAVVVTENPAICMYLADRCGYGRLAPRIEAPERGAYLRWMVFSTAVVEPAVWFREPHDAKAASDRGWGDYDAVVSVLDAAAAGGAWLLGEAFSAADVMLGGVLAMAHYNGKLPPDGPIEAYVQRLAQRPAYQRASDATWPAALFGE